MSDKLFARVTGNISHTQRKKLEALSAQRKIPMSRLVGYAIDTEFLKEVPFEFNTDYPDTEYIEYAYANEAGIILKFIIENPGFSLDLLLLLRDEIGIPDKETFLLAFRELEDKRMIEHFIPNGNPHTRGKLGDDYKAWRLAKEFRAPKVKMTKKRSTDYEMYQQLKKRFGDE